LGHARTDGRYRGRLHDAALVDTLRGVAKVQLGLLEGKVIELPFAATGTGPAIVAGPRDAVTELVTAGQAAVTSRDSWRSGRDLKARRDERGDAPALAMDTAESRPTITGDDRGSIARNDSLQTEPVRTNLFSMRTDSLVTPLVTVAEAAVTSGVKSRSGRDSNPRPPA
jgi:hypothetical protein